MRTSIVAAFSLPVLALGVSIDLNASPDSLTNMTASNSRKFVNVINEAFENGAFVMHIDPSELNVFESSVAMEVGFDRAPDLVNYDGAIYALTMIRKINQPQWWETFETAGSPPSYIWRKPTSRIHKGQPSQESFEWNKEVRSKMDLPQAWTLVMSKVGANMPRYDSFQGIVDSPLGGKGPRYYFRLWDSTKKGRFGPIFLFRASVLIATGEVEIESSQIQSAQVS